MKEEQVKQIDGVEEVSHEHEQQEKGAFWSSMLFVGGFIFVLYILIYWLFMVRVDI